MNKQKLKKILSACEYVGIVPLKKEDIINTIIYKTEYYIEKVKEYNNIFNIKCNSLTKEQNKVYVSIMSFMLGIIEKDKISNELNTYFIKDISNMISSKINYIDYPTIKNKLGLLLGGAGTGKTHLVSYVIDKLYKLYENNDIIQVLAPTNKAIKVIKKQIKTKGINYSTISKFLQQDIEYTEDGKIVYKTKIDIKKYGYHKIKYIIIDEASMISRNNWIDLNRFIFKRIPNIKILLIGDDCQLPPVNEKSSIVFNIRIKRFRLNNIVRTNSKEITNIYNIYRNSVKNNGNVPKIKESNDFKYITSFKDIIQKEFDVINDKIISYSNNSVDKYNEIVRNIVFDNPVEKYVIGEKIIFGSSVKCYGLNGKLTEKYRFYSNDEATVKNVNNIKINTKSLYENEDLNLNNFFEEEIFEAYQLYLNLDNKIVIVYRILDKDIERFNLYFEKIFYKIKKSKLNKKNISKLWDIYYTFKNTIHIPIKYSYALTVYKSQGSTFKKIFIDIEDIHNCVKDLNILNKTLYTSITRASNKIRCYKPTKNDYKFIDLEQYPFLKKYNILEHKKAMRFLKDGRTIIYTKNEYQNKNKRKLVRGRVVHILDNSIYIGNSNYTWKLNLKDDVIIYI